MAMRVTLAGTLQSTRTSNPQSFRTATKQKNVCHILNDSDDLSDSGSSTLQLNIPHMKSSFQKSHPTSFPNHQKLLRPKNTTKSHHDEETTMMLQFLNNSNYPNKSDMPETWSVKLPAYHQHQSPLPSSISKSPKQRPPPRSMFRGKTAKVSSAVAMFQDNVLEEDDEYSQNICSPERREPFCTIGEEEEKKQSPWKSWFSSIV
jgi:hypothetical protein